jgi:hypothetical protein
MKGTPTMGAKQTKIDKLHELFADELTRQLKNGNVDPETGERTPPTAALLAVVGQFLFRSNVKPTDDSPQMSRLRVAADALPFKLNEAGEPYKVTN